LFISKTSKLYEAFIHNNFGDLLLLSGQIQSVQAGPFGFEPGMTKQQIIDKLGQDAIVESKGDTLSLSKALLPHSGFEQYIVIMIPSVAW